MGDRVLWLRLQGQGIVRRLRATAADDRGDVPGWVMVTMMTAALVLVVLEFATGALTGVLEAAFDSLQE
jgi:hypothetical protein